MAEEKCSHRIKIESTTIIWHEFHFITFNDRNFSTIVVLLLHLYLFGVRKINKSIIGFNK